MELWIEKTTQNDILVPLAQRLGANLVPGEGDTSEIRAREVVERAMEAGRPMRILYISDFDPRGHKMPVGLARKIEFLLRDNELDLDITLVRIPTLSGRAFQPEAGHRSDVKPATIPINIRPL